MTVAPRTVKSRVMLMNQLFPAAESDGEELGLRTWTQLVRNGTDEARLQSEIAENGADLPDGHGRFFELEVNEVVITIDLVAQAGERFELMIELQDLVQVTNTGRVNFEFNHT